MPITRQAIINLQEALLSHTESTATTDTDGREPDNSNTITPTPPQDMSDIWYGLSYSDTNSTGGGGIGSGGLLGSYSAPRYFVTSSPPAGTFVERNGVFATNSELKTEILHTNFLMGIREEITSAKKCRFLDIITNTCIFFNEKVDITFNEDNECICSMCGECRTLRKD